jgi:methionyl-tRNA formyltransferase
MNQPSRVRVYYLASGALGIPSLETMANSPQVELCGVGTQPDRPAGRRRQLQPTPVAARADELGIPCERIPNVNDDAFLDRLEALAPDVIVVASFGQLLKDRLIELAPHGCLNLHASLLPRHRGASPIQAAILAGDTQTGVSYMRIDAGLDTGPVYEQVATAIDPNESAGDLEARLASLAAEHVVSVMGRIVAGELHCQPQPSDGVTVARKIQKQAGTIDWTRPAEEIARQVRAYNPWPRAVTTLPGGRKGPRRVQVTVAEPLAESDDSQPGTVVRASDDLAVSCGEGVLLLRQVVPEGKSEMSASEFLRGARIEPGTILGTTD